LPAHPGLKDNAALSEKELLPGAVPREQTEIHRVDSPDGIYGAVDNASKECMGFGSVQRVRGVLNVLRSFGYSDRTL